MRLYLMIYPILPVLLFFLLVFHASEQTQPSSIDCATGC